MRELTNHDAAAASLEIAAATDGDLWELYSLAKDAFGDNPGWSDERTIEGLRRDVVFVARERALAAGYVALRHEPPTETIVVEQILVAPGHEQRGIGHAMLAYAEGYAIAAGAWSIRIVAERSNWRARGFYRRIGFVPIEPELLELALPRLA